MADPATLLGHLHGRPDLPLLHLSQVSTILQIFVYGKVHIQGRRLRQETDQPFRRLGLFPHVDAAHIYIAFRLVQRSAEDIHRRGLPRAIGTQ